MLKPNIEIIKLNAVYINEKNIKKKLNLKQNDIIMTI